MKQLRLNKDLPQTNESAERLKEESKNINYNEQGITNLSNYDKYLQSFIADKQEKALIGTKTISPVMPRELSPKTARPNG